MPRRAAIAAAVVSLAFGAFTLWPFFLHSGIPAYQHDWSWAPDSHRFRDGLLQMVSTWDEEGFGHANPFANLHPIALLTVASGAVLTPKIALILVLCTIAVVAGTGMFAAARELSRNSLGAALAAFLYVASPVFYNKTSAGQIAYLEAYAVFAWLLYFLLRATTAAQPGRWYAAIAFAAGLTCVQPQFFIFAPVATFCFACTMPLHRGALMLASAIAGEVVLNAPFVYAATTLRSSFTYTVPHPLGHFEALQSAQFTDAVRMLGYIVPYAKNAYAHANAAPAANLLWLLAFSAAAALLLSRSRAAYAVLAIGVFGVLLSMGEDGPLAAPFIWGFAHVPAVTLLREFYHSAVLTSSAMAMGAACAAAYRRVVMPVLGVVTLAALLPLALGHNGDVRFAAPSDGELAASAWIRSNEPGRVLPYPFKMPLDIGDAPVSGVDVFSYVDRSHMRASEYGTTPELDDVAALVADGREQTARFLLERDAIRYVVWNNDTHSAFPLSLQQRGQGRYRKRAERVFNGGADQLRRLVVRARCFGNTCWGVLPNARPLVDAPRVAASATGWLPSRDLNGSTVWDDDASPEITFSAWHLSPADGWVPADQWRWADPFWALLADPQAVTAVRSSGVELRSDIPMRLAYTGGPLQVCAQYCFDLSKRTFGAAFKAGSSATIRAARAAAVGVMHAGDIPRISPAHVDFTYDRPWRVRATLRSEGPALVVFRTRFDKGWALRGLHVLRHVRVDGSFNGWIVDPVQTKETFDIAYSPQSGFFAAALLELSAYALVAAYVLTLSQRKLS